MQRNFEIAHIAKMRRTYSLQKDTLILTNLYDGLGERLAKRLFSYGERERDLKTSGSREDT